MTAAVCVKCVNRSELYLSMFVIKHISTHEWVILRIHLAHVELHVGQRKCYIGVARVPDRSL